MFQQVPQTCAPHLRESGVDSVYEPLVMVGGNAMIFFSTTLLFSTMAWMALQVGAQQSPGAAAAAPGTSPATSASTPLPENRMGVLIRAVNPQLPSEARKISARGEFVSLQATITTDGHVKDLTITNGDPMMVGPAIDAARQWQFVPLVENGVAVESQMPIRVGDDSKGTSRHDEHPSSAIPREPQEDVIQEIKRRELFQLRDGVTFPKSLYHPDPQYSEAARKSKLMGRVTLGLVVDTDGKVRSVWVVRPLGEGLDENAIDAVKRWNFMPATKDGKAVPLLMNLSIGFRL
jgi:TonB family protein